MSRKIIQVGDLFDGQLVTSIPFCSDNYLLDADIIIIDFEAVITEFGKLRTNIQAVEIPQVRVAKFMKQVEKRVGELTKYLENGGNLFVLNTPTETYKYTVLREGGEKEKAEIDFLNIVFIDRDQFSFRIGKGNNLTYKKEFASFFEHFHIGYNYIFEKYVGQPMAYLSKTEEVVSVCVSAYNGKVLLLPSLSVERKHLYNCREDLINLDIDLKERRLIEVKAERPDWSTSYSIGSEYDELILLNEYERKKQELEQLIVEQQIKLLQYEELKSVVWESGNRLEAIVAKIFIDMGYEVTMPIDNRDDLILKKENDVIVIEIKGVKSSAAEKYAAQLSKWVATYYAENDVNPKGILLVNAFKDKPLRERNEPAFPNQMLKYCKQQEHLLITTTQLLALYLDFNDGKLTFDRIHQLLFAGLGIFEYDTSSQIKQIE